MQYVFRKIKQEDKSEIFSMMKEFYSSDAVLTNGSDEIFEADIENCVNNNPYLDGYVFERQDEIIGYAMLAKSFSTEFGKHCIWLEDLYLKPQYRGKGIVPEFVESIKEEYKNCILRLEVEKENEHACYVYKKLGFKEIPYCEMKLDN